MSGVHPSVTELSVIAASIASSWVAAFSTSASSRGMMFGARNRTSK
jgi:hypothetical protein